MYTDSMEKLKAGMEHIREAQYCFSAGPLEFWLKDLMECHDLLVRKYAPFKVGDRVILTRTPAIEADKNHGWLSYKHFLIKGAKATVQDVSVHGDGFFAHVWFDDESWIDRNGNAVAVANKSQFRFHEDDLVRI
jgi:hypothetical protein